MLRSDSASAISRWRYKNSYCRRTLHSHFANISTFFPIKKEREKWIKDGIEVTIDEWPIIGYILEIEGDKETIFEVAKTISPDKVFKNYRLKELLEGKMQKEGKDIHQLKEEYFKETGFDLGKIEMILL